MDSTSSGRVLVTGADGFIGRHLCAHLKQRGYAVRAAVRRGGFDGADECWQVGDIGEVTDWLPALRGVDAVVHLAARMPRMEGRGGGALDDFRRVNVLSTERLAQAALRSGIKRFVFMSSVKVNGGGASEVYSESDIPCPEKAYGISKHEAEQVLMRLAADAGFPVVVLRPALVYGPGALINFKGLIRMVRWPLPFKEIRNQRSLVYVGNLTDAVAMCLEHPMAVGEVFMVSDGPTISTEDLLRKISSMMGVRARLFFMQPALLRALCRLAGKDEFWQLARSCYVDSAKIRERLGWRPPFSMEEGLAVTMKAFAEEGCKVKEERVF